MYTVASSLGHTHFSMLHAEKGEGLVKPRPQATLTFQCYPFSACNSEKWVWPGDEAMYTVCVCNFGNGVFSR